MTMILPAKQNKEVMEGCHASMRGGGWRACRQARRHQPKIQRVKVCCCVLQDVRARPPLPVPGDLANPLHELPDVGRRQTPGNVSKAERFEQKAYVRCFAPYLRFVSRLSSTMHAHAICSGRPTHASVNASLCTNVLPQVHARLDLPLLDLILCVFFGGVLMAKRMCWPLHGCGVCVCSIPLHHPG